ncbi:hypothetical protein HK096_007396, partial [Nowakowskiella sp. JEL0078]
MSITNGLTSIPKISTSEPRSRPTSRSVQSAKRRSVISEIITDLYHVTSLSNILTSNSESLSSEKIALNEGSGSDMHIEETIASLMNESIAETNKSPSVLLKLNQEKDDLNHLHPLSSISKHAKFISKSDGWVDSKSERRLSLETRVSKVKNSDEVSTRRRRTSVAGGYKESLALDLISKSATIGEEEENMAEKDTWK